MMKLNGFLVLIITMILSGPVLATTNNSGDFLPAECLISFQDHLSGGWTYTAEGAADGYEKGIILIVDEGDNYKVQVQIGNSTILGENVTVKKNTISFKVYVEREEVSVELTAYGSKIAGTATSPSAGVIKISGVKSLSAG